MGAVVRLPARRGFQNCRPTELDRFQLSTLPHSHTQHTGHTARSIHTKPPPCSHRWPAAPRAARRTRSSNSPNRTPQTAALSRFALPWRFYRSYKRELTLLRPRAQDHYAAPQAGPSGQVRPQPLYPSCRSRTDSFPPQSAFRNSASRPDTTDPAAQQFFQHQPGLAPSAASSHQPFNLAPLGHALPQAGPSTPAWAHAFVSQQHQPTSGASAAEQERFARAFNRPGPSAASPLQRPDAPAWVGDFHAHAQEGSQQRAGLAPSSSTQATAPTQYHPAQQQNALSRLQGQGFGTAPMVNYLRDAGPAPSMSTHVGPATAREHEGKAGELLSPPPMGYRFSKTDPPRSQNGTKPFSLASQTRRPISSPTRPERLPTFPPTCTRPARSPLPCARIPPASRTIPPPATPSRAPPPICSRPSAPPRSSASAG